MVKISKRYLIFKDFSRTEALTGLSRSVTIGGILRISVEINCNSQEYKVLQSEVV